MFLVSKVDKVLEVPKTKTSFPNKEDLKFNFKAGEPLEVPDYIAESYSKSYPHIFSVVKNADKVEVEKKSEVKTENTVSTFDAVDYLINNPKATEEELKKLKQTELLDLCNVLDLQAHPNTGVDKLASKVAQELKIKNEAEK